MLIRNGILAFENCAIAADIRINSGTIAEIGKALQPAENEQVIDATGLIVIPGGVDVHTHMDLDLGFVRATDDFYTGTVAAACGGTTTIVDHMAFGSRGFSISSQVDVYHRLADGKAVVDYGFHGVLDHVDDDILAEIKELCQEGITSHKFYLTYSGKISDAEVIKLMDRASQLGVLLAVHAENDGAIAYLTRKNLDLGNTTPLWHAKSRPAECEAEAVSRMLWLAKMADDAPIYFVHLSEGLGLDQIRAARSRGQKRIFAETCPQYLMLDQSRYERDDGLKYIMSPPLRTPEHQEALWRGIEREEIDVVATDHCPFFYSREKQLGTSDFSKAPGGAPGVELRIPLMFSNVMKGRLSLERFVSLCCANPARLFGLYPQKGVLAVGSDADIVLIDPNANVAVTFDMLHENTDYTPYEGEQLTGYPVMTISRGEIIVQDGQFVGQKGRGQFIKRKMPDFGGI